MISDFDDRIGNCKPDTQYCSANYGSKDKEGDCCSPNPLCIVFDLFSDITVAIAKHVTS